MISSFPVGQAEAGTGKGNSPNQSQEQVGNRSGGAHDWRAHRIVSIIQVEKVV
jgi:hypothetical protein